MHCIDGHHRPMVARIRVRSMFEITGDDISKNAGPLQVRQGRKPAEPGARSASLDEPAAVRHGARQAVMAARALVGWWRYGDLFEPCVACFHAMCAELCLFSRSLKMQAAVQSTPRDKSLMFRPSADNSSRRRLRLLSCRVRSVALRSVKCATRCDILRTMANR